MSAHLELLTNFWKNKRVFVTGHTGFKGSWLSFWLHLLGAKVEGYALEPYTNPNLFDVLKIRDLIQESTIANINDFTLLKQKISNFEPDVVFHLAAQPLVRYSYKNPIETYQTNVLGTVHVLESIRLVPSVKSCVVVTTDKCYENKEWHWGYRETDHLGGFDPYSSSKACAEIVTAAYRRSFFPGQLNQNSLACIASARAGNVIGGGDWSEDRLIPDAIRAFESGEKLLIRNPQAIRPWQHVFEPLLGYLTLAKALYEKGPEYASAWNFGPVDSDCRTVESVINLMIEGWASAATWEKDGGEQPHEATFLKLDCSMANNKLQWQSRWSLEEAVKRIVAWHQAKNNDVNMYEYSINELQDYMRWNNNNGK